MANLPVSFGTRKLPNLNPDSSSLVCAYFLSPSRATLGLTTFLEASACRLRTDKTACMLNWQWNQLYQFQASKGARGQRHLRPAMETAHAGSAGSCGGQAYNMHPQAYRASRTLSTLTSSLAHNEQPPHKWQARHSRAGSPLDVVDGDLHLHSGLDRDRGDLLDHIGGRVQVDQALVDPARTRG